MSLTFMIQLSIIFLVQGIVYADVNDDLKGVNKEIHEKQQLLKKVKKVENKVTSELQLIEKNLMDKETNLSLLNSELKTVEARLTNTQRQIAAQLVEVNNKKEQITKRVSSLYKAGEMGNLRIFFSSGSVPQVLENRRYMKAVLDFDRKLFQEHQERLIELGRLKESLEKEASKKERLSERILVKKQEIEAEKSKKAAYLSEVKKERKGYQVTLKELQANARRLQQMVERLEARNRKSYSKKSDKKHSIPGNYPQPPVADKGFGSQRGKLTVPVSGEIVSNFGKHKHAEFNSFTFNNGISFSASHNADIHAVYDGEVIFADSFKGYGNMLIIDHGGGYFTLYAHTSRIVKKVGSAVKKSEIVAHVGDTDSSRGAQLYFEIRYQGKPVDPGPWFR
jgi:septal ring factor EnvC (AmiA/AmiB activator)